MTRILSKIFLHYKSKYFYDYFFFFLFLKSFFLETIRANSNDEQMSWYLRVQHPLHRPLKCLSWSHCYLFSSRLTQLVRVVFIRNLENPIRWLSNHITQGHLPVSVSGESISLSVQLLSFTSSLTRVDFLRLCVWFSGPTRGSRHLI